jgi:hypothetical protein
MGCGSSDFWTANYLPHLLVKQSVLKFHGIKLVHAIHGSVSPSPSIYMKHAIPFLLWWLPVQENKDPKQLKAAPKDMMPAHE